MRATSGSESSCYIYGWGVSARLVAGNDELLEETLHALPKGFARSRKPASGPLFNVRGRRGGVEFSEDGQVRFDGRSRKAFRAAVADAFETLASVNSRTFAFLHAGCVEVDGRVILMPGRSHAGKSTLVAAFLRRGAGYLSDDMVPIDRRLRAHPFPRPMGIRPTPSGWPKRTSIKSLGARTADRPLPIALVWSGSYDPLAIRPTFKRRPGVSGFAELLAQAPGARIRPEVIVPIFTRIAGTVPVFSGVRGEADAMVDAILKRLKSNTQSRT